MPLFGSAEFQQHSESLLYLHKPILCGYLKSDFCLTLLEICLKVKCYFLLWKKQQFFMLFNIWTKMCFCFDFFGDVLRRLATRHLWVCEDPQHVDEVNSIEIALELNCNTWSSPSTCCHVTRPREREMERKCVFLFPDTLPIRSHAGSPCSAGTHRCWLIPGALLLLSALSEGRQQQQQQIEA